MSVPSANEMYHAAQVLIRQGHPVFPCSSSVRLHGREAKQPLTVHGYQDASTDPIRVKHWWSRYRGAAVGIPTGKVWDVLDVDCKGDQDGRRHLAFLQRVGLLNGCKRVIRTPSDGLHLYFKASSINQHIGANKYIGLDIRSAGGYVIAPGSYIDLAEERGYAGSYEDQGETEDSTDEPLMWDLIVSAIRPVNSLTSKPLVLLESEKRANLGALRYWLSNQTEEGDRNHSLFWTTMRCIDAGIDPHELVEVALHIGLSEAETLTTIEQAMRRAGLTAQELRSEAEVHFPDTMSA